MSCISCSRLYVKTGRKGLLPKRRSSKIRRQHLQNGLWFFIVRLVTRQHNDVRQRLGVMESRWRCSWIVSRFSCSWWFPLGLLDWLGWPIASLWWARRILKTPLTRLSHLHKEDIVEIDNFYQESLRQSSQSTHRIQGRHRWWVDLVSWDRTMWARRNSREGRVQCRGLVERQVGASSYNQLETNSSTWMLLHKMQEKKEKRKEMVDLPRCPSHLVR